ncbi:MAG: transferrin-binding protein-like solute binding protein, partial [Pseudomonadota bacterium]|nr:transferrin-binding protein-like solute binding protein [Pseudomonadota bacterium]
MRNLSLITVCLLLASCGGGGGGGALVDNTPTVATPTYTEYVNFVNNGGSVPDVQGQIFRSRGQWLSVCPGDSFCVNYLGTDADFESFPSVTLEYSQPDANGNQSISMSARVNWDGDPFSGSDTFTGTLDQDSEGYLFLDDHLAKVKTIQETTQVYTIGFVDFGGQRTVEKTKYVTQLLQYRSLYQDTPNEFYSYNYDFLAFVMGDQTWASDMPSSGSATYNGFTQMLESVEYHDGYWSNIGFIHIRKDYFYGYSTFTADFASRNFSGQLDFEYGAYAYNAENAITLDFDYVLELNGTISGTSFSGTVSNPNL